MNKVYENGISVIKEIVLALKYYRTRYFAYFIYYVTYNILRGNLF